MSPSTETASAVSTAPPVTAYKLLTVIPSVPSAAPWAEQANYATSKGGIKLLMESMMLYPGFATAG